MQYILALLGSAIKTVTEVAFNAYISCTLKVTKVSMTLASKIHAVFTTPLGAKLISLASAVKGAIIWFLTVIGMNPFLLGAPLILGGALLGLLLGNNFDVYAVLKVLDFVYNDMSNLFQYFYYTLGYLVTGDYQNCYDLLKLFWITGFDGVSLVTSILNAGFDLPFPGESELQLQRVTYWWAIPPQNIGFDVQLLIDLTQIFDKTYYMPPEFIRLLIGEVFVASTYHNYGFWEVKDQLYLLADLMNPNNFNEKKWCTLFLDLNKFANPITTNIDLNFGVQPFTYLNWLLKYALHLKHNVFLFHVIENCQANHPLSIPLPAGHHHLMLFPGDTLYAKMYPVISYFDHTLLYSAPDFPRGFLSTAKSLPCALPSHLQLMEQEFASSKVLSLTTRPLV